MFDRKQSFLRKGFRVGYNAAAGVKKTQAKDFRKEEKESCNGKAILIHFSPSHQKCSLRRSLKE
jgi:hypothetical protein